MTEQSRGARLIIIGTLAISLCAAFGFKAAPDAGLKVAAFDPVRGLNDNKITKASNDALKAMYDGYQTSLQTWKQNALLNETDQKRLGDLIVKEATPPGLTDPEKAEKKTLLDKSANLNSEAQALTVKTTPTQAEKDRITELTKVQGDTASRLESQSKAYDEQLRKLQADNQAKVLKEVKAAIAEVAKKSGYNVVFSTELCWYADNDITDAVLKQINK